MEFQVPKKRKFSTRMYVKSLVRYIKTELSTKKSIYGQFSSFSKIWTSKADLFMGTFKCLFSFLLLLASKSGHLVNM